MPGSARFFSNLMNPRYAWDVRFGMLLKIGPNTSIRRRKPRLNVRI